MDMREVLQEGFELVESAFVHVSHGGPTRADAERWIERAGAVLAEKEEPCTPVYDVGSPVEYIRMRWGSDA
jgi:hypothetical protein